MLIKAAADDKFATYLLIFEKKNDIAYDSCKIACFLFLEKWLNLKLTSAANNRWRFMVKLTVINKESCS